jgi:hypothetical protein
MQGKNTYSYLFSVKKLSPQNGGFIRAFWQGKEFRTVAGNANSFFKCEFEKYRD